MAAPARAVELDCLAEPWRTITLSAAIEGVVEEVAVDRGDSVEAHQVVARLESNVERASVEVARVRAQAQGELLARKARLDFAENSLKRQQSLAKNNIVSQSEMDEAVSGRLVAEAELRVAREAQQEAQQELRRTQSILDRRTIRSPISGVVVDRILSPGEYADPPQIMQIAQIDPLRIEAFAPIRMFGRIRPGMAADVMPEAPLGGRHRAQVTVADRVLDAASGTFRVRLELPNPEGALPAGFNCRVSFAIDDDASLASSAPARDEASSLAERRGRGSEAAEGARDDSDPSADLEPEPSAGPGSDPMGDDGILSGDDEPSSFAATGAVPDGDLASEDDTELEMASAAAGTEAWESGAEDATLGDDESEPAPGGPDETAAVDTPSLARAPDDAPLATTTPPTRRDELEAAFWKMAERVGCRRGNGLLATFLPLVWAFGRRRS